MFDDLDIDKLHAMLAVIECELQAAQRAHAFAQAVAKRAAPLVAESSARAGKQIANSLASIHALRMRVESARQIEDVAADWWKSGGPSPY